MLLCSHSPRRVVSRVCLLRSRNAACKTHLFLSHGWCSFNARRLETKRDDSLLRGERHPQRGLTMAFSNGFRYTSIKIPHAVHRHDRSKRPMATADLLKAKRTEILDLAAGKLNRDSFIEWVRQHSIPAQQ